MNTGSRQLWPTLDYHQQKGTTMNFKTIAVALSLALAFQPVASFAAGTSSTAKARAAAAANARRIASLRALYGASYGTSVDTGTGTAAAVDTSPADTGVQPGSVVIESGTVISGPLY